jgi:DNA-binding XRE family transcriptional regulator
MFLKTKNEQSEIPKLVSESENYMDAFRYNVGILRNNYGWSVRMLAEKADLSADTLNGFLKGTSRDCNLVTAFKLARAFNKSIDE